MRKRFQAAVAGRGVAMGRRFGGEWLERLEQRVFLSVAATSQIAANSFSAQSGVQVTGAFVGSLDAGDFMEFSGIDFGSGVSRFEANIGTPAAFAGGQINLFADSKTGTFLGTLTVRSTGSWNTMTEQSAPLVNAITGVHDLYLVFATGTNTQMGTGIGYMSSISFPDIAATSQAEAESFTDQSGTTLAFIGGNSTSGTEVGNIDNGDWLKYGGVDFGSGVAAFEATLGCPALYAGGEIDVHVDGLSGPLLGTLPISATGDWTVLAPEVVQLTGSVTGIHDVYLEFATGSNTQLGTGLCALDWIRFLPAHTAGRPATGQVEAESFDTEAASAIVLISGSGGNKFVESLVTSDVLEYDDIDFGASVSTFDANIGSPSAYAGGLIHVYADGVNGTLLGTLSIASTGGWGTLQTQMASLTTSVSGVHDLFLVFDTGTNTQGGFGLGNLDWFTFS